MTNNQFMLSIATEICQTFLSSLPSFLNNRPLFLYTGSFRLVPYIKIVKPIRSEHAVRTTASCDTKYLSFPIQWLQHGSSDICCRNPHAVPTGPPDARAPACRIRRKTTHSSSLSHKCQAECDSRNTQATGEPRVFSWGYHSLRWSD